MCVYFNLFINLFIYFGGVGGWNWTKGELGNIVLTRF